MHLGARLMMLGEPSGTGGRMGGAELFDPQLF